MLLICVEIFVVVMREAKRRKVALKEHEGQDLGSKIESIMVDAGMSSVIIPYDINNDKQRTRSKSATDKDCHYSVNVTIKKIKGKDEVFITDSYPRLGVNRGEYITDEMLGNEQEYYDKQIIPKLEAIIDESKQQGLVTSQKEAEIKNEKQDISEDKLKKAVSGLVKLSKSR